MNPQNVVLSSMAITTAVGVTGNLVKSQQRTPPSRIIIGGFAVTIGLLLASESQPELAKALSVLILVAMLTGPNGTALFDVISKLTKG